MNFEVIAIGSEIVTGYTINTNAAFISQELLKAGFVVHRHMAVPDEEQAIKNGFKEALERSDIVIATGGLGPTCDDISRKVAADLFACGFSFREEVADDLKRRFGEYFPTIVDQSTLPDKATALLNPIGTAPGLIFQDGNKLLILLPGVPPEMMVLFSESVLPYINTHLINLPKKYLRILSIFGLPESAVDPLLRTLKDQYPYIEYGIYTSMGSLSIHLSTFAEEKEAAQALLQEPVEVIRMTFQKNLFESTNSKLEEAIHNLFISKGLTLSLAESCSGGLAAARLTALPGCSTYFKGGIVAYSNDLKKSLLGVPSELLDQFGAVSPEVAQAMAEGILRVSGSSWSGALTGIAGPAGGTPEKPVGTVWGAVCAKGRSPVVWKIPARGNRATIITRSTNALFAKLLVEVSA